MKHIGKERSIAYIIKEYENFKSTKKNAGLSLRYFFAATLIAD